MKTLAQVWAEAGGKPCKARKVLLNEHAYDRKTVILPIGTVAHLVELKDGELHGVVLADDGKEMRKRFADSDPCWVRLK